MIVNGVDFGHVLCASGAMGFAGEGYPYHRLPIPGLSFRNCTFVAKTTTVGPREGNMPVKEDGATPRHWLPECIWVDHSKGVALNAVGLTGPGAFRVLEGNVAAGHDKPFLLSFMAVGFTAVDREEELKRFLGLLKRHMPWFKAPVGLQINFSCPNTAHGGDAGLSEIRKQLTLASVLGVPLMPKLSVDFPPELAARLSRDRNFHSVCISNTVKYGALPDKVDWIGLFGSADPRRSPLAHYGGGGLSGAPLLPLVEKWIRDFRAAGGTVPVNAGGGILGPKDVLRLADAGADSVFIGSIAFLRPWRVARTIKYANKSFAGRNP